MMLHTLVFVLSFTSTSMVLAGKPGQLLPLLQPHAHRGKRSLVPRTLLVAPIQGLPAGAIVDVSAPQKRGHIYSPILQPRAVACQDTGYAVCTDQTKCCPIEGSCCTGATCCPNRFSCCSGGDCCPDGYDCATVDGVEGCCPTGQTCTTTTGQCADASYVACPNENFCCPSGEKCTTVNGQPACGNVAALTSGSSGRSTSSVHSTSTPPASNTGTGAPTPSTSVTSSAPGVSTSFVVIVPTSTQSTIGNLPTTMSNADPQGLPSATVPTFTPLTTNQSGAPTSGLNPDGSLSAANPRFVLTSAGAMFGASVLVVFVQVLGYAL